MRHSNYLFGKGSIVFASFPPSSSNAYLNGRPLIIVSNPIHIMNTVIVATTGTRDKPGIEISLYNRHEKKYYGGAKVSKIYPYSIQTIYIEQIESCIGQLDPYIMKELDNAIDFHMGKSDRVPGYLIDMQDELCGITYNQLTKKHYTAEIINPKISAKRPYTKMRTTNPKIGESNSPRRNKVTQEEILNWKTELSNINSSELQKNCSKAGKLVELLDTKSIALIVSRIAPVSVISEKYSIQKKYASYLRITLTNGCIDLGLSLLNDAGKQANDVEDCVIVGMLLAKHFLPDKINSNATMTYDKKIDEIAYKYSIDLTNRKIWKSVEQFQTK